MPGRIKRFVVAAVAIGGALSLTMCGGGGGGEGGKTTTQCPNGICGGGGDGGKTTTSGTGGSTSSSSSGTGTGGSTSSSSSSGTGGSTSSSSSSGNTSSGTTTSSSSSSSSGSTCVESWLCSPWSTSGGGNAATRTCVDSKNCGTTTNKPATSATLPALDVNYFKCNVEPVLEKKCSMLGCHGTETGRALRVYARGRLRNPTDTITSVASTANLNCSGSQSGTSCMGSASCPCNGPHTANEWQKNFDAARGFALDASGKTIPSGSMDSSEMLHQPVVGGASHAGIHLFKMSDADYTTLKNWLNGATLATCSTGLN